VPAISSKISHVAGFRLATLASTQPHAVLNTNLQKRVYTTDTGSCEVSMKRNNYYTITTKKHAFSVEAPTIGKRGERRL